jgi:hypothetical protein
MGQLGISFLFA